MSFSPEKSGTLADSGLAAEGHPVDTIRLKA
jgi:hypothetical protein